ncbi:MAG: ABC transporter permease [Bacteroidetes bacterium]|nr:MAG: ABC transporter permease [Bacteroidota bacterium]
MRPEKGKSFSQPIIKISYISIALGLTLMIASISIVVGFKHSISNKVIGFTANLQIIPFDNNQSLEAQPMNIDRDFIKLLPTIPNVKHIQFVAQKGGVLKTEDQIQGVVLKGVESNYDWSFLSKNLVDGKLPKLTDKRDYEVLISKILADKLKLSVGDKVRVWFVNNNEQGARGRKFTVSGIYNTGLENFDGSLIIGDLDVVAKLNNWKPGEVGTVEILLKNPDKVKATADAIYHDIPYDLNIVTATELYPQIFNWLDLLDMNVVVILVLLILVASITMISTLLILIIERTSMVGLLKALGATNKSIGRIFLLRSTSIVLKGMLWGNVLGLLFYFVQLKFRIFHLDPQSYYVDYVPVELHLQQFLMLNIGVFAVSLLILMIPTWYINRVTPSKALRYE